MCYNIYCQFGNDKLLHRLAIFCLREAPEKNNKVFSAKFSSVADRVARIRQQSSSICNLPVVSTVV